VASVVTIVGVVVIVVVVVVAVALNIATTVVIIIFSIVTVTASESFVFVLCGVNAVLHSVVTVRWGWSKRHLLISELCAWADGCMGHQINIIIYL